ncbi:MAG: SGNH/GDSL hydrolase family protein [Myxococcales bacterium]|nr:SGNH/GDSL hydrolase family protein [Myxococcales bacterium]
MPRLLLLLGSTLMTLLAAELLFRAFDLRGYHDRRRERGLQGALLRDEKKRVPGVKVQYRPYAQFAHVYDGDPRGYFDADHSLTYRLNRHGFRGADWERAPAPGVRRIVLLGDSFAFGEGVRVEHTLGARLQESVNEDSGTATEVLTLAAGGWGTRDEINYLERAGIGFEPDLVIVVYVLNDAEYAGGLDLWGRFRQQYENRRLQSSYLASYVYAGFARRRLARAYIDDLVVRSRKQRGDWAASFGDLARGRRIAESAGARFAVAIFPFLYELDAGYPFRPLHEMVAQFCTWNGIRVIDLFDAFEGHSDTDLWVHPSDQHPNEDGHRIAADALADFIRREHLLPDAPNDG